MAAKIPNKQKSLEPGPGYYELAQPKNLLTAIRSNPHYRSFQKSERPRIEGNKN